jgi:hypothetical protein
MDTLLGDTRMPVSVGVAPLMVTNDVSALPLTVSRPITRNVPLEVPALYNPEELTVPPVAVQATLAAVCPPLE